MKNELEIKLDNKAQEVIGEVAKEHGGGGATYTAGNGITITNENVINADVKVLEVQDITQLTDEQCESLNVGDIVDCENITWSVTKKDDYTLALTFIFLGEYEMLCYSKNLGSWYFNKNESTHFYIQPSVYTIEFDIQGGTLLTDDVYFAEDNGLAIMGNTVVLFTGEKDESAIFTSTIMNDDGNNFYYKVSVGEPYEDDGVEVCDYTVEQITVGAGSGVEYVYINPNATEIDLETARKLTDSTNKYNCVIVLDNGSEASHNIFLRPDAQYLTTYTSNIINGKYWKFQITSWQEEGIFVSIQEINIPAPSHYIRVYGKTDDTNATYHTITIPCDDYTIETYEDLCQYLVGKGINSSDETYLPVNDGGVVVGVTVHVGYSSGEPYYNLWLQKLHIVSSGSIFVNSVTVNVYDDEDFTITHLPQNE